MPLSHDDPFPHEAVRDLLGVVRAIYAAAKHSGASKVELVRIARVGKDLADALDLAVSTRQGTMGRRAAWERAEQATRKVGDLVDSLTPAEPLVMAARGRVTGMAAVGRKRRDER
jgi:hypothetical protein